MKHIFGLGLLWLMVHVSIAQVDLSYYLPANISYNPAIPTPKSIIGHEVGEWHISHDRLVNYMYAVAQASNRITIAETGRTFETRPLLLLTVTSPDNHKRIEEIRTEHLKLTNPSLSGGLNVNNMPNVLYTGFSIHGNEPSGSNAALVAIYYLAAAQGPEIEKLLSEVVILFDPSFNPDGLQRFSSWVNSRRSMIINGDVNDAEHNEPWPGGRTNHYWFDLNRDWMAAQLPESQSRIVNWRRWMPNILTDHHEMGTNSTFFFQPGVPNRVHPLTPQKNIELTMKMGEYHAKALDKIGSLYYAQESFDDFYYGKGSTFPDAQGAIGILFEQASSRANASESVHGLLTFPFTIRNQFTAFLSTLEAGQAMRTEFLNYQRDFFKQNLSDAAKDPIKGFLFGSGNDPMRSYHLAELIDRHGIVIHKLASDQTINGKRYVANSSYVISLNQTQYRLIKGMFDKRTTFTDSLFYDISSWTLPLAFGLDYEELKSNPESLAGRRFTTADKPTGEVIGTPAKYAYVFENSGYYTPRAIYQLLSAGIRVKVSHTAFFHPDGRRFPEGSLMISLGQQDVSEQYIHEKIKDVALSNGIQIFGFDTGLDYKGVSLGSPSFSVVRRPKIAMLVGPGVSGNDAGEVWHLLDTRYQIPISLVPIDIFNRLDISKYNTLILSTGSYSGISDSGKEKLKTWVQNGGTLIGLENALTWMNGAGLGKWDMKSNERNDSGTRPYNSISPTLGAQELGGAIFEIKADLTHPLFYGYERALLPVFKSNTLFMQPSKNQFGNPAVYTTSPLISGYISKPNLDNLKNCAFAGSASLGQGRIIGFTENLTFRAFWYGTNKMLMNAIFFGPTLNSSASR